MGSPILSDSRERMNDNSVVSLSEKWPEDVVLYQQFQVEQITLPDYAQCLAVEAFLRMSGLLFRLEQRTNAAEMSPTGKVPFIQTGTHLIAEFEPIVAFAASKGFSLSKGLPEYLMAEMQAYVSMLESVLTNAELYVAWLLPEVATEVTKPRYGCAYPWPLNWLLPWRKQREVRHLMTVTEWADKRLDQVLAEVKTCLRALSDKLDKNKFFMGSIPTELDAVVFGHLYTIQTTKLPGSPFSAAYSEFSNLREFCKRIEATHFF